VCVCQRERIDLRQLAAASGYEPVSAGHAVVWDFGCHKLWFLWVPCRLMYTHTGMVLVSEEYLQLCSFEDDVFHWWIVAEDFVSVH
jgi:hypothetical protein